VKVRLYFLIVILFISGLKAQVVTSTPPFPTENNSITITFDATQANNTSLVGYTGDLYVHTGVNTNLGPWQHVIESWGNNSTQPKLTRIGTDLYQLVIGNPREFYNVTNPDEHITSLNFVFRSADKSKQTEDIFLEIYEGGLEVTIQQPSKHFNIVKVNEPLTINVISTSADTLFLYLDNQLLTKTTEASISYVLTSSQETSNYIIAKAIDSQGNIALDSAIYVARGTVQVEALPQGIKPGINYTSETSVTLALFAPFKDYAYVIGDFNNWVPEKNSYMKKTPNDSTYWIELTGLTSGQEYGFQYLVDGEINIADPYADKILDPWNDQYISDVTYPNLKKYPEGKTTEPVSVLQTAQQPYNWHVPNFQKPNQNKLIIYELLIRDFVESHNYETLIDTLDYLENLGVNAIELMPITEFEGNISWGYNPSFMFAVDKYYGTKNALKNFIDECHSRGIAVILDMVLNHQFGQSPLVRLYWDSANNQPSAESPWFNQVATHPYSVGSDFNHESLQTKKYVDRVNKYWLEEYKFDGLRFDLSKGFTQFNSGSDVSLWGQYDQSRINILERMANQIKAYDPTAYLILEHFADNSEETVLSNYGFILWGNLNYNYNEATMSYTEGSNSDFSWISYKERGWNNPHVVGYMESHDEERLMYKNLQYGNSKGSYDIQDLITALQRMKMAATFFLTIPGPKMIWQFGELGYDYSINYPSGTDNDRLTPKPIRWDYLNHLGRWKLYHVFSALAQLKKEYPVFSTNDFSISASGAAKEIKLNDNSMNVYIIGNFGVTSTEHSLDFQTTGTWYDYFSNDNISYSSSTPTKTLAPGEFHMYTTVELPLPSGDLISDMKNIEGENKPTEFSLSQNYPNPFNPTTTISFSIPNSTNVELNIYNVLGEKVKTLFSKVIQSGNYQIQWEGTNNYNKKLTSGIYFYQIVTEDFIQTKKMILLK